ncbi:hypothetical protein [Streptomyces sp. NBC_00286]|uniref:hypothetical protein n=1 Tax=Streptomyces sp. NBC_00286 TaxID=2975701 RepID=UPI002E29B364|nr:hypothetical protein [Streptomyces sp. NBC_00286]
MKLKRPSLDDAFFALLGVGLFAFIVLAILNDMGVIDISWLDLEGSSSGDNPGGYNQGPNNVPARPGSGAGGARGR